ncbi:GNAT family N-acetyltransferase [Marinococcus luteus]|uniref:GNAT family N-acetyltransferase n=1 Tax=Marinococcus luteus TaxID=1122204 RepID=UPI002ACCF632|nr:GNAT family N-acetyltransferase [Marinococcus luteus]MDZ5782573.1 GNAT family N-acetyltransferase [Marinococcus luteus]
MILRPLQPSDFDNYQQALSKRKVSQHLYDPGRPKINRFTKAQFTDMIRKRKEMAAQDYTYIYDIFHKDGNHLGHADITTLIREEFQWGMLGYMIHNQHWNRGFGKEAVQEVLRASFDDLHFHRIEAHINVDNHPSISLAEKTGMEYECLRRRFIYENDAWTDNLVYYKNA